MAMPIFTTAVPFGVNSIAQEAAVASLAAYDELAQRVDSLVAERSRVCAALRDEGWDIPDSEANFVWFGLGARSGEFADACEDAALMVRQYGDDGVRITVAEAAGPR